VLVVTAAFMGGVGKTTSIAYWRRAGTKVWGTVPERVTIAACQYAALAGDGLDAYRKLWRRVLPAARSI
jgi:hypothetical protein